MAQYGILRYIRKFAYITSSLTDQDRGCGFGSHDLFSHPFALRMTPHFMASSFRAVPIEKTAEEFMSILYCEKFSSAPK